LIDIAKDDYAEEKVRARMAVAATNTWDDRVREFWEIVDGHLAMNDVQKELESIK
jgi:hypothetical protein